jgi:hypothetical protein
MWLKSVNTPGASVTMFCQYVRQALGPAVIVTTNRKTKLHILRVQGEHRGSLRDAKQAVVNCSARPTKLDDASVYAQNIATMLDFAQIPYPGDPLEG